MQFGSLLRRTTFASLRVTCVNTISAHIMTLLFIDLVNHVIVLTEKYSKSLVLQSRHFAQFKTKQAWIVRENRNIGVISIECKDKRQKCPQSSNSEEFCYCIQSDKIAVCCRATNLELKFPLIVVKSETRQPVQFWVPIGILSAVLQVSIVFACVPNFIILIHFSGRHNEMCGLCNRFCHCWLNLIV